MNHKHLIGITLPCMFVIACTGCGMGKSETGVGDSNQVVISNQPVTATLLSVEDPLDGPGVKPDKGWRFVGINIRFLNKGKSAIEFQPAAKMKLMASWRPMSIGAVQGGPCATDFAFGIKLAPGAEDAGCVVFQAPRDVKVTALQMSSGSGSTKVSWDLK